MVSAEAVEKFKENDVELTVPPGAPRPILIIVMVGHFDLCLYSLIVDSGKVKRSHRLTSTSSSGSRILVSLTTITSPSLSLSSFSSHPRPHHCVHQRGQAGRDSLTTFHPMGAPPLPQSLQRKGIDSYTKET